MKIYHDIHICIPEIGSFWIYNLALKFRLNIGDQLTHEVLGENSSSIESGDRNIYQWTDDEVYTHMENIIVEVSDMVLINKNQFRVYTAIK